MKKKKSSLFSRVGFMHTFFNFVRASCENIHVVSYVQQISIIKEVVLELVTSPYYWGTPNADTTLVSVPIYYSFIY